MEKTLLVYYSFEGNIRFAAEEIAKRCGAELEELKVKNEPPRKGLAKFLHGGKSALFKDDPGLYPLGKDVRDYESVILAYPVWAGTFPPAVQQFLKQVSLKDKEVIAVAASASGNAEKSFVQLRNIIGEEALVKTLSLQNPLKNKEQTIRKIEAFVADFHQAASVN